MLGIALVNKPVGISSHDAIYALRRKLQIKRIGHAGTLDPLAQGLLVVAIGPATRFLQFLSLEPKTYVAQIKFGYATTTYDAEGEPALPAGDIPNNLPCLIQEHLGQMSGLIDQVPPAYSAIKINGQPAYKAARAGVAVELKSRRVFIEETKLLACDQNECRLEVICSGGTYIRSYAHDLGVRLGCGAHLGGLTRTKIGHYTLQEAHDLGEITSDDLIPLPAALTHLPHIILDLPSEKKVRMGQMISDSSAIPSPSKVVLMSEQGDFIGIGQWTGGAIQPECILPI